jgi:hypothetical protein
MKRFFEFFKKKENKVEDKEKAFEMAKTEDVYRELAEDAKKLGFEDLAKKIEQKGEKEAERVRREYEKGAKMINKLFKEIFLELERSMKEKEDGKKPKEIIIELKKLKPYFISKIEGILEVKEQPYDIESGGKIFLPTFKLYEDKIAEIKNEFHETCLPNVAFVKSYIRIIKKSPSYTEGEWKLRECFIVINPSQEKQKESKS